MTEIIVTNESKLRKIIQEEVAKAKQESVTHQEEVDAVSLEGAVCFLEEQGYPVSKARIYKLTSSNRIPYKKFGHKLVFSKRELLGWAEGSTRIKNDRDEVVKTLAESAKQKMRR